MSPFRIWIPLVLVIAFVFWVLYRLLIKKDLKKHTSGVITGVIFIAVWAVLYFILK